eukprot:jgi/Bigna1/90256/estExt_fgenesh1_pg.C_660042
MSSEDLIPDDVLNFDPSKLNDSDIANLEKDLGDTDVSAMKEELKAMGIDLGNLDDEEEDNDDENDPSKASQANTPHAADTSNTLKKTTTSIVTTKEVDGDVKTTKEDGPSKKDAAAETAAPKTTAATPLSGDVGNMSREQLLEKMKALQEQHNQLKKTLSEVVIEVEVAPNQIETNESASNPRFSAPARTTAAAAVGKTDTKQPEKMPSVVKRRGRKRAVKVIVVGNSKCGKTSIINRYVKNVFSNEYKYTIGCDYSMKQVQVTPDITVRLQLWDIAGQDRFIHLSRAFFKNSAGAIPHSATNTVWLCIIAWHCWFKTYISLVCDVTRPATMEALRNWKGELDKGLIEEAKAKGVSVPVIMIANKVDLLPDVQKSIAVGADAQKLSEDMNLDGWFIGSAKADEKITEAMMFLLKKIVGVDSDNAKTVPNLKDVPDKDAAPGAHQTPAAAQKQPVAAAAAGGGGEGARKTPGSSSKRKFKLRLPGSRRQTPEKQSGSATTIDLAKGRDRKMKREKECCIV